jgi:hypothetical protein
MDDAPSDRTTELFEKNSASVLLPRLAGTDQQYALARAWRGRHKFA